MASSTVSSSVSSLVSSLFSITPNVFEDNGVKGIIHQVPITPHNSHEVCQRCQQLHWFRHHLRDIEWVWWWWGVIAVLVPLSRNGARQTTIVFDQFLIVLFLHFSMSDLHITMLALRQEFPRPIIVDTVVGLSICLQRVYMYRADLLQRNETRRKTATWIVQL